MSLIDDLEWVRQAQVDEGFLLTGVYLVKSDMNTVLPILMPDEPSVGACGRYKGVPVFPLTEEAELELQQHGRVHYSGIRGAWDLGDPVED